ncbi:hypothetical protein BG011_005021 [Mortierella polycephala]|uniref:Glutathione S-transferase family protein n=1 Tax=Mortierella polycephala TaxID=41804 RepID=A0A9P6QC57_9FUNG|nr:hypothetical protein BG011_005021 [Mortierella polycephala]
MTKYTLYKNPHCPYAARAVTAMAETKQEHAVVLIDLSTARPEWYLKDINPFGQVPALKIENDDGTENVVIESLIVAEFIADLHPESGLIAKDPLQRAQTRYLIQHWGNHVQPAMHKAIITLDPTDSAKFRQLFIIELEKVDALLRKANRYSDGPFFLGNDFTFADLALASLVFRMFLVPAYQDNEDQVRQEFEQSLSENQNLKRFREWREALLDRESVQNANADKATIKKFFSKFVLKRN